MNTIKKRALTSIAACFMACLMFSMPVLAASNSFSKTTVKLNAIDGVSQIAKVFSGSVLEPILKSLSESILFKCSKW